MKATLTLLIAAGFIAFYFGFFNKPQPEGDLRRAAAENRTAIAETFALFNQPNQ